MPIFGMTVQGYVSMCTRGQMSTMAPSIRRCGCLQAEFLLIVILAQWMLIANLLFERYDHTQSQQAELSPLTARTKMEGACECDSKVAVLGTEGSIKAKAGDDDKKWTGVALCLMLKRPKWWYKRYNVMIHNALANVPSDWAVQLMVDRKFWDEVLEFHRGIPRLLKEYPNRIIITELPPKLASKKPKFVLKDRFVWEHVVAPRVLTFHGEGMLCSNSVNTWEDLRHLDYLGAPWSRFQGRGGVGSTISYRHQEAMLAAIGYDETFPSPGGSPQKEDEFFVSTLIRMNDQRSKLSEVDREDPKYRGLLSRVYSVATPEETLGFAGTSQLDYLGNRTMRTEEQFRPWGPMAVIGTLSELSQDARNWVLGTCPEIKVIFPSLHHPTCFGAAPNMEKCALHMLGMASCEAVKEVE